MVFDAFESEDADRFVEAVVEMDVLELVDTLSPLAASEREDKLSSPSFLEISFGISLVIPAIGAWFVALLREKEPVGAVAVEGLDARGPNPFAVPIAVLEASVAGSVILDVIV